MVNIITKIPEIDEQVRQRLAKCSVATVHEAMGRINALEGSIRPLDRNMKLCGRALTVKCHPGDNLMLVKAVSMAKKGDVIIADMGSIINSGPFGEVLAVECLSKQVAGLVISCSVRDTEAIIKRGFPVFSAGICVRGTAKATLGTINQPITIGGVIVNPGDFVLGDADGVVIVPADKAEEAITASAVREEKEKKVMERLLSGESLFTIYKYQATFDKLGCKEI